MKRLLVPALLLASLAFASCSPSAEEKAKDSLSSDSTKKDMETEGNDFIDSMNRAFEAAQKAAADSSKKDSVKK